MLHTGFEHHHRDFGSNMILDTCILDSLKFCRLDFVELTSLALSPLVSNVLGLFPWLCYFLNTLSRVYWRQ